MCVCVCVCVCVDLASERLQATFLRYFFVWSGVDGVRRENRDIAVFYLVYK